MIRFVPRGPRRAFPGGVHPDGRKHLAGGRPIEALPTPAEVRVPLLQHAGAACSSLVKPRQEVAPGEPIGRAEGPVWAAVHAPVAGTVSKETVATLANGRHVAVVPIKTAAEQPSAEELLADHFGGDWPLADQDALRPDEIVAAARDAGLVGMGGAAFPTWVKLAGRPERPIDTLVVNGCECEPYLTADQRLMEEAPRPILSGALLAARAVGAERVVVAVEDDKPAALARLAAEAEGTGVEVRAVRTRYPQGAEKQLVFALLGRTVPFPGLPLDRRVVVINVGTAAALARAVRRGRPLTHRVVSVTGGGVARPANLLVPIGAPVAALLEAAGGLTDDAARVVAGGPMMGFTLGSLETPVTKGTSGVTALNAAEVAGARETACVRCGRCVEVCPMRLVPARLALAVRRGAWDLARHHHIDACMECGSCAWACPAAIPLVQLIRAGKARLAA